MKRRPLSLAIAAGLVALILIGWLLWPRPGFRIGQAGQAPAPATGSAVGPSAIPVVPPGAPGNPSAGEEPSHLADALNAPSGDIRADLRILDDLFQQYRSATHGSNPVGENVEITAALTGKNAVGFAFIPPHHPAINASGELCDRWGTPFFFHQLSADQMEIRSAGPDRKLWTDDDVVVTPGLYFPQK